jgi:hypothetical protein
LDAFVSDILGSLDSSSRDFALTFWRVKKKEKMANAAYLSKLRPHALV